HPRGRRDQRRRLSAAPGLPHPRRPSVTREPCPRSRGRALVGVRAPAGPRARGGARGAPVTPDVTVVIPSHRRRLRLRWLLAAAAAHPGAVVQGRTRSEPLEMDVWASPHARTVQELDPPGRFGQTCNILYSREVLEAIDGFDETLRTSGEDVDLMWRARAA